MVKLVNESVLSDCIKKIKNALISITSSLIDMQSYNFEETYKLSDKHTLVVNYTGDYLNGNLETQYTVRLYEYGKLSEQNIYHNYEDFIAAINSYRKYI